MKKLYRAYIVSLSLLLIMSMLTQPVFAASDLWSVARTISATIRVEMQKIHREKPLPFHRSRTNGLASA